jgi:hypothetical protein
MPDALLQAASLIYGPSMCPPAPGHRQLMRLAQTGEAPRLHTVEVNCTG